MRNKYNADRRSYKAKALTSIVLLIAIALSFATASAAWLISFIAVGEDHNFRADSIASYFAGGDGTAEKPYQLNAPIHLYRMAWLQQQEPSLFDETTHFELISDIEMAGALGGAANASSGAIPPIGSTSKPFIGHFNGNDHTISNLWVSTNPKHWIEKPAEMEEYVSDHVGLFGYISDGAIIENFVLDKVEITSNIDATIGIICGYVDAMVKDIGVYNGIMSVEAGATCSSKYSILGDKSKDIHWVGMPELHPDYGGPIGDLVVDPNASGAVFDGVSSGVVEKVPNSTTGTAYYAGPLTAGTTSVSGQWGVFDLTGFTLDNNKKQKLPLFSANSESSLAKQKINEMFEKYGSGQKSIVVNTAFHATGEETYISEDSEGNAIAPIPEGLIWFKPQTSGTASMAFAATNQSDRRHIELYKCRRVNNKLEIVDSVIYALPVDKNDWKNGSLVYYEYEVTDEDVASKYEFLIGLPADSSLASDSFGFYALTLAGTSPQSDDDTTVEDGVYQDAIYSVDYVVAPNAAVDTDGGYAVHKTILNIGEFTAQSNVKLYYLAMNDTPASLVHYYAPAGVTVVDQSKNRESYADPNTDNFSERKTTGGS